MIQSIYNNILLNNFLFKIFSEMTESPIYYLLFGSGGVMIILLTIFSIRKKQNGNNFDININIGDNKHKDEDELNDIKYNLHIDKKNQSRQSSYVKCSFSSEDFYIKFLAHVEEKKRKRDEIDYE